MALSNPFYNQLGQIGRSATYDYIVRHSKIDLATAEAMYALSVPNQLLSFKSEFLANRGAEFNDREKTAIKNALASRFLDFCNRSYNNALKPVWIKYNTDLAGLVNARVIKINACKTAYNTALAQLNKTSGYFFLINAEKLRLEREACSSSAYNEFNTAATTLIDAVKLTTPYTDYNTCATSELITAWTWQ